MKRGEQRTKKGSEERRSEKGRELNGDESVERRTENSEVK